MSWNYRILAHKDGDDYFFQIHGVYYDEEGRPNGYTTDGASVAGESIGTINWVLDKMKECINKPILSADEFPDEWSPNDS
jgi:hypothetical protein